PWVSLGWGFLGVVVIPVAVIILFVVLIGFPFAIFGIYFYTVLLYLASIFIAFILGERIIQLFKKEGEVSLYLSFIVGIITLFILGLIPVLGFITSIGVYHKDCSNSIRKWQPPAGRSRPLSGNAWSESDLIHYEHPCGR
ncbi:hypothetical protein BXT86_06535, partial [candidate division WOR-3 bacterium 4484_100]